MKKLAILLSVSLLLTFSCKNQKKLEPENPLPKQEVKKVKFKLEPKNDSKVSGNVVITEENAKVTMHAIIQGLDKGVHTLYIKDQSLDANNNGKVVSNINADKNGFAAVNFSTKEWCIGCDDAKKNIIGKAITINTPADSLTSQSSNVINSQVSSSGIIK